MVKFKTYFILVSICFSILPPAFQQESFLQISKADKIKSKDDVGKSIQDICNENGWDYQQYTVETSDGYILQVMRIPGSLNEKKPYLKKPVVLLQHGLEGDASTWVFNNPDRSSAFNLAAAGYDVWMGNNRGSKYSLNHKTLNPDNPKDAPIFWNFSFEEMGLYDLPAEIDFILNQTNQKQLSYVGHSQGTTQFFIGLTMKYAYFKEKVNVFVALAPVARLDNTMATFLKIWAAQSTLIKDIIVDFLHYYNIFPRNWVQDTATETFCFLLKDVCKAFLELFLDLDPNVDNLDRLTTYLSMLPSGAGYKSFAHYAQFINSKKFQRYDYGAKMNVEIYGQSTPPIYDLNNIINFPIALFGGSGDELADPTDVKWLAQNLNKNVIFYHTYNLDHMSFAIAKDMSFFQVDAMGIISKYATNN